MDLLGPRVRDPVRIAAPEPARDGDAIVGEVVHVDRFGNLVTTIPASAVAGWDGVNIELRGFLIPGLSRAYAEVIASNGNPAGLGALIGSTGRLEIAVGNGSAAGVTGAARGERVTVRRRGHA